MSELTNLLSHDRKEALARDYLFRVATLEVVAVGILILIHGVLLLPSYLYLSEEVKTRTAHLESLAASLEASEEREVGEQIAFLTEEAKRLLASIQVPRASSVARAVFGIARDGVRITGITISPPETGEGQMRVQGIAATRDSLRRYYQALSGLPFVSRADLPLSVYAEERDITFSITITGSLKP